MSVLLLQALRENFAALPAASAAAGDRTDARRAQLDAVLADGLPGPRAEAWRYTSLRALERRRFGQATELAAIDATRLPASDGPRLVFINGVYSAEHSRLRDLPAGVELAPLSSTSDAPLLEQRYARRDEAFARLNAALAIEGLVLRVAAGVRCTTPVHLLMVGAPAPGDVAVHLRHQVQLGEAAQLTLVEHQLGAQAQAHLVNSLLQVRLDASARLEHVRVQNEDSGVTLFARSDVQVGAQAEYRRTDLEFGAALARHELNVTLHGSGARAVCGGILLADGLRHVETRLGIVHAARDTQCDLLWRGLGSDRGRAVFHGGILIQAGADGAAARLSNKNLLLSPHAEIDTQPVLEIYADEVQASHGATVGQLDDRALFYLRSRGLGLAQARALLTTAFCRVVLAGIDDAALRDALDAILSARLPGVPGAGA